MLVTIPESYFKQFIYKSSNPRKKYSSPVSIPMPIEWVTSWWKSTKLDSFSLFVVDAPPVDGCEPIDRSRLITWKCPVQSGKNQLLCRVGVFASV